MPSWHKELARQPCWDVVNQRQCCQFVFKFSSSRLDAQQLGMELLGHDFGFIDGSGLEFLVTLHQLQTNGSHQHGQVLSEPLSI